MRKIKTSQTIICMSSSSAVVDLMMAKRMIRENITREEEYKKEGNFLNSEYIKLFHRHLIVMFLWKKEIVYI